MYPQTPIFHSIVEYFRHVQNKINSNSSYFRAWPIAKIDKYDRMSGLIFIDSIEFISNEFAADARFRFQEDVTIEDGIVIRRSYAYEYYWSENGVPLYFRYERDPERARPFVHEELHLHANRDAPRFITHATSFDQVFDFILHNFYFR